MPPTTRPSRSGAPKTKGAVRAKSGCYTCRIRRKKCDEQMNVDGSCATCVRLRLQCLGFGAKRPEWLRENRNVLDLRDKIKTFLASQGMIKGHSGSATRAAEQEQQILSLSTDYVSPTNSPQTPTLSISSTNDERPSTYPLRTNTGRYPDSDHLPVMQELSPDSPLERSEYLLPPVPYSSPPVINSLDSWQSNHSLLPQRPHSSHFSRLHNVPIQYEEDIVDVVSSGYLLPSIPAVDQYTWPLLDEHQNASLDYYMKHVLRAQYLHASDSLDSIIWKLIHTSDNARQAACLLSDLHRKSTQKNRLGIMDVEDVEALSRMQMVPFNTPLTEGDALAGLCIVSYFLFRGGKGQWQTFLDTACNYSLSVLNHWGGARKVLLVCSESLRFIIKTSIWFDVLASATLVREPRFLGVIQELYGRQSAFFDDVPAVPMAEYSMMSVMGCENHIVLALAEIASLANWKEAHVSAGSLSVKELVRRGHKIEEILIKPSSYPSESDVTLDPAESQRAQQRRLTSEVFRASAYVYLHSVVSEIIEAVNDTDGPTGRAVVRSVVFSICICGCLTEEPQQQSLSIGNSQQVSCLIQEVWKRRSHGAVDWREVMREAEMLLV
ncbi:fungal-specific transcription factor domain-containing protein [Boletus edulis BED1]|uniref:Fungal-specific transcription factor domain-containing protein n=1 Tax=Boletus edulis BED1 TaxID=1328754 RepID=A0AAD4BX91_BOLED|nr:fungal-specific transcription factor domain-containing protein [Boletus edulis BED1]